MTIGRRPRAAWFYVEIVCIGCSAHGPGEWFRKRPPLADLKVQAQISGWRLRVNGEHLCPTCAKKQLERAL